MVEGPLDRTSRILVVLVVPAKSSNGSARPALTHRMRSMSDASVVIVNYRTADLTVAAAASALAAGASEVVIVDNASGDEIRRRVDTLQSPRVRICMNTENEGFGAAANRGAREATTGFLVFLNSDAELSADALVTMSDEAAQWSGRALVGPRLIGPAGDVQHSAGLLPGPVDLAIRALGLHAVGTRISAVPGLGRMLDRTEVASQYKSARTASGPINTTMVSGACIAIGREAFDDLGGFDERFFMYFEDADLCRRAATAGIPVRYVPSALVAHVGGASSSEDYHFSPIYARSMRQYLGKWYGPGGTGLVLLLLWIRVLGFTVTSRPRARRAWRALLAAVRDEDPRA